MINKRPDKTPDLIKYCAKIFTQSAKIYILNLIEICDA